VRPLDPERRFNVVNLVVLTLFGLVLWLLVNGGA